MKLSNMIMILIIIQATIIFYDQVYSSSYELESYGDNETVIWKFVSDPTAWTDSVLLIVLVLLGSAVAAFIVVGTFFNTPSDTAIFSTVFTLLIAAGAVPIISLYHVFTRNVSMFGCSSMPCTTATLAWVFTGGLIAIFYVLSVLEWWSGRSMSTG